MVSASAYVLNVRPERRETLLSAERGRFGGALAAEPVPLFQHSRRAPLIVLASFQDGYLTHVGDARKGASAGTDLVRLTVVQNVLPSRRSLTGLPPPSNHGLARLLGRV